MVPIHVSFCSSHSSKVAVVGVLNLSLNTSNNPKLVLHFSCSSSFRVCTNLRPLKSNRFSFIGIALLSDIL